MANEITLWALDDNGADESRWAMGISGPAVYLTCPRGTAELILAAVKESTTAAQWLDAFQSR